MDILPAWPLHPPGETPLTAMSRDMELTEWLDESGNDERAAIGRITR